MVSKSNLQYKNIAFLRVIINILLQRKQESHRVRGSAQEQYTRAFVNLKMVKIDKNKDVYYNNNYNNTHGNLLIALRTMTASGKEYLH